MTDAAVLCEVYGHHLASLLVGALRRLSNYSRQQAMSLSWYDRYCLKCSLGSGHMLETRTGDVYRTDHTLSGLAATAWRCTLAKRVVLAVSTARAESPAYPGGEISQCGQAKTPFGPDPPDLSFTRSRARCIMRANCTDDRGHRAYWSRGAGII